MKNTKGEKKNLHLVFEHFATMATRATGSSYAFILASTIILVWIITGPLFKFSDTWQLVINTGTTVITFLMVFLIQKTQNKEALAVQLKLNELIASVKGASNRLLNIEDLSEDELTTFHRFYEVLSKRAKEDLDIKRSHSIEEAEELHEEKYHSLLAKKQLRNEKSAISKKTKQ